MLAKTVSDRNIGLLVLSEHYQAPSNFPSWSASTDGKCSVALTAGAGLVAEESGSDPDSPGSGSAVPSYSAATGPQKVTRRLSARKLSMVSSTDWKGLLGRRETQ